MHGRTFAVRLALAAFVSAGSPAVSFAQWTADTPLPTTFVGHSLTASSGYLYNIGGMGGNNGILDGNGVYYAAIKSRGELGAWTAAVPLPEPVMFHSAVAWGGVLYVIGGYHVSGDGFGVSSKVYYSRLNADGSPGPWTAGASLPQTSFLQSAAVWNGTIFVTGGWGGSSLSNAVYSAKVQADGSLGAWTAQAALPVATYAHVAVQDNALYVIGGSVDGGTTLSNAVYYSLINADGTLAGWHETTPLPQPVAQHVAALVGGKVYVAGGWTGSQPIAEVDAAATRSDMSLDAWLSTAALPTPLYLHAGAVADGVLYVSGGSDGTAPRSTVYSIPLFTPQTALVDSIDFEPNTLNLASKGKFITAYLEFPGGAASAADISVASLRIVKVNGKAIEPIAALSKPTGLDTDPVTGAPRLMVKFDRGDVEEVLGAGDQTLQVTGALTSGKPFSGAGKIWAIQPGKPAHQEKEFGHPPELNIGRSSFKMVHGDGGSVSREDGQVDIPAGALASDLPVTVKRHDAGREETADPRLKAAGSGVEFGPEGTRFQQPVTLTLSYDPANLPAGASEDDLAVHYWNPNSERWEQLASAVDKARHIVTAQTSHFSLYQVFAPVPAGAAAPAATPPQPPAPQAPATAQAPATSAAPAASRAAASIAKVFSTVIAAVTPKAAAPAPLTLISDGRAAPMNSEAVPAAPRRASYASAPAPAVSASADPLVMPRAPSDDGLALVVRADGAAARRSSEPPPSPKNGRALGTLLCVGFLAVLWYKLAWRSMA